MKRLFESTMAIWSGEVIAYLPLTARIEDVRFDDPGSVTLICTCDDGDSSSGTRRILVQSVFASMPMVCDIRYLGSTPDRMAIFEVLG